MFKRKVMDDLDALLADLQSTTSHISDYQQGNQRTVGDRHPVISHVSDNQEGSQRTPCEGEPITSHISDRWQDRPRTACEGEPVTSHISDHQQSSQGKAWDFEPVTHISDHQLDSQRTSCGCEPVTSHTGDHQQSNKLTVFDHEAITNHSSDHLQGNQTTVCDRDPITNNISDHQQGSHDTVLDLLPISSLSHHHQHGSQGTASDSYNTATADPTPDAAIFRTATTNVTTSGSGTEASSRDSTPPPLPPPPSKDVVESMHIEPLYEVQQVKPVSYSNSNQQLGLSQSSLPHLTAPTPSQPMSSSLSSNLSELDMLLQDLSSAQFMAEVDRRNAANMSCDADTSGPSVQPAPVISTKPTQERTVDSLLFELENTSPPQTGSVMSEPVSQSLSPSYASETSHYEAVPQTHQHPGPPPYRADTNPAYTAGNPDQSLPLVADMTTSGNASTATRELEDLMASLSEFKVSGASQGIPPVHGGDPPYAFPHKMPKSGAVALSGAAPGANVGDSVGPVHATLAMAAQNQNAGLSNPDGSVLSPPSSHDGMVHMQAASQEVITSSEKQSQPVGTLGGAVDNNLDAMLGNLHTDMTRQGIMTVPKGHCAACAKPIIGQVITALGKIWHPEHFACVHCKEELGTRNFFERDGQPYCEQDYHNLFSPRCAHCSGPILDKCVTALEKSWHPEHFFCAQCGRLFGDEGFHEKDGKAYCREDYFDMFAPKCGGCLQPIMDNYISALSRQWHPECFICQECHIPFGGGSFFDHEGMPYCETHYHAKRGSLCAGCHKPITGRCITAMYKKFHPEHFVCAFCLKQLNKGTFKEQNEKPYCHPCFVKLFG